MSNALNNCGHLYLWQREPRMQITLDGIKLKDSFLFIHADVSDKDALVLSDKVSYGSLLMSTFDVTIRGVMEPQSWLRILSRYFRFFLLSIYFIVAERLWLR